MSGLEGHGIVSGHQLALYRSGPTQAAEEVSAPRSDTGCPLTPEP